MKERDVVDVLIGYENDKKQLILQSGSPWVYIARRMLEKFDDLTGHRYCNTFIDGKFWHKSLTREFKIDLTDSQIKEFYDVFNWTDYEDADDAL